MRVALIAPSLSVTDAFSENAEHLFKLCGGNTGNFAFVFALHQLLSPDVDVVSWEANPDMVKEKYDAVVFACANQLGPHTDLGWLADRLVAMDRPIVAIGLGAQTLDTTQPIEVTDGTRRWLDVIADHAPSSAPNIGVRGAYTLSQVERLGHRAKAVIVGCPSNFINSNALARPVDRAEACRRQHRADRSARRASSMAGPAADRRASGRHGGELFRTLRRAVRTRHDTAGTRRSRMRSRPMFWKKSACMCARSSRPRSSSAGCVDMARRFIDAASWIDAMRKFDFVVGPRFHGVMLAVQAGVPGGVIAHDSRTFELCQTMGIPVRHYSELKENFSIQDLKSMFPFDGAAYDQRRAALAQTMAEMFSHAGIAGNWRHFRIIENNRAAAA